MIVRLTALMLVLSSLLARQCCATALLEVGPGKAYGSLAAIPWNTLQPGDTVNIYYRSTPYYEKVLFSARGTASAPIHITGVPGPNGELPIIDGQNASTSSQFQYTYSGTQDRGLIVVSSCKGQVWGYKPGYVVFENLELRNAYSSYSFTDGAGATRVYTDNAASIFVERGEHIVIHNCTIDGSGNGFFVASGASEEVVSRDITLENCNVYGNGVIGSDRQHNVYTEAVGVVMQFNRFGRPRLGSGGNNIKDRSAGTVIRYNWIEGGAHALDLVDAEDSTQIVALDPSYRSTYVYSNIFLNTTGDATRLIHYGGDSTVYTNYRKGWLYCYQNTFVIQCDQTNRWWTVLFQLDTNEESVDARNNVFYAASATNGVNASQLALMDTYGVASFGANWISPTWINARSGAGFAGTVTGTGNFVSNSSNNPGFANLAAFDLRPASGSQCLDYSGGLNAAVLPAYDVICQYVRDQSGITRPINGTSMDLGALESGSSGGSTAVTISTLSLSANNVVGGNSVTGTINLTGAAPAGGLTVSVASNAGNAAVPATVTVASGATSATFTVTTSGVASTSSATITATAGSASKSAGLTINPAGITSISLNPSTVAGGGNSSGTVTLNGLAGGSGLVITIASDNSSAQVPASVTVAAGASSATFAVTTSSVSANTNANINGSDGTATKSAALTITPPVVSSLTLNPSTVVGGSNSTATVSLTGAAPAGGFVITLSSSQKNVAQAPASVSIPAGATSATFTITTKNVNVTKTSTISAKFGGVTVSATLTATK